MSPVFWSELSAGAARRAGDLGCRGENLFDDVQLSIGFGQRRAAGRRVVEHERAFVHLRKEARLDEAIGKHASADEHECDDRRGPGMVKDGA